MRVWGFLTLLLAVEKNNSKLEDLYNLSTKHKLTEHILLKPLSRNKQIYCCIDIFGFEAKLIDSGKSTEWPTDRHSQGQRWFCS